METINIIMLGYYSGKTCFMLRYFYSEFRECDQSTSSFDFKEKIIETFNGKIVILKLWDTGGNESCKGINGWLIKSADGIILMYNIGSKESFDDIFYWIKEVREKTNMIPVTIIGNMCDDEEGRIISRNEGEELAKKYDYHFYESSNFFGINIEEPINDLIGQILKKREEDKISINNKFYSKIFNKYINY